jgi:hypothetical protein
LDAQNAGNGISGFQISKIFWAAYPQTPLYMRGMSATHMAFSHCLSPSSILSHIKVPFQKMPPPEKSLKKALIEMHACMHACMQLANLNPISY